MKGKVSLKRKNEKKKKENEKNELLFVALFEENFRNLKSGLIFANIRTNSMRNMNFSHNFFLKFSVKFF